jgi:murein L,D-transpeptidase YafK
LFIAAKFLTGSLYIMKKIFVIGIAIILLSAVLYSAYRIMYPEKKSFNSEIRIPENVKADSVAVFKSERKMVLYSDGKEIKTYSVSLGRNPIGPKEKVGDKKTPEGSYILDSRLENSKYHLAIHISYPNEKDKLNAEKLGVSPGGDIMIHGLPNKLKFPEDSYANTDWTDGCIAVSNDEIEEIWELVEDGTPIAIYP